MTILCPVILAGGGGTRLWPLSRDLYPKQFLNFGAEYSMLQLTLKRLDGLKEILQIDPPVALCNEAHSFLVEGHAALIHRNFASIILEPEGRNTAPALTVAALQARGSDPVILMMPADHLISDVTAFHESVVAGFRLAADGMLVSFGIKPTHPETGFGYIKCGGRLHQDNQLNSYSISEFVEKPPRELAESYLQSGDYFWNSGIFMMKASVWLAAISKYNPAMASACEQAYSKGASEKGFYRLDAESFLSCPADSIDYAVMEKIGEDKSFAAGLVEMNAGWSDIGSWSAVWDENTKDQDNNVLSGDVITYGTRNTYVSSSSRLVATVGCDDLIIVETADAVLVGNRNKSQDVKKVIAQLKENDRTERVSHTRVSRPWGNYETLDKGEQYQVKRLTVNPGKKLSLQLHHKRSEHWVVVRGIATVTCGEKTFRLNPNQSTYIPLGAKHRLENAEATELEVIEVQSGSYLGEDDIVRFEDDFGRTR
jgi:mannose-1-phosphate guanylyltransferase/mannose-6-phosphate isomerase